MTDKIRQSLLDLKARQEKGAYTLCPRCGMNTMHPQLYANALSRVADIQICSLCGTEEALDALFGRASPIEEWAAIKE